MILERIKYRNRFFGTWYPRMIFHLYSYPIVYLHRTYIRCCVLRDIVHHSHVVHYSINMILFLLSSAIIIFVHNIFVYLASACTKSTHFFVLRTSPFCDGECVLSCLWQLLSVTIANASASPQKTSKQPRGYEIWGLPLFTPSRGTYLFLAGRGVNLKRRSQKIVWCRHHNNNSIEINERSSRLRTITIINNHDQIRVSRLNIVGYFFLCVVLRSSYYYSYYYFTYGW